MATLPFEINTKEFTLIISELDKSRKERLLSPYRRLSASVESTHAVCYSDAITSWRGTYRANNGKLGGPWRFLAPWL
jgi:hypothetical protein